MKKRDIIEKHILNRKELHDYMLKIGLERIASMYDCEVDKDELSKLIYEYIDYIKKESKEKKEVLYFDLKIRKSEFFENVFYQESFKYIYFFEYENDKFIYWTHFPEKGVEKYYLDNIEFLTCLTDNFDNLNGYEDFLKFLLKNNINQLEMYQENKNQYKKLLESYKKYDYVKVLSDRIIIDENDLKLCTQILGLSESTKELELTVEERMCLLLIIFYAIKNIYFNYSDLRKFDMREMYYGYVEQLAFWLELFISCKDKIKVRKIYSKKYDSYIDLKDEMSNFLSVCEHDYYLIRRYRELDYLKEPLQLIYFEYLINNGMYKEARNYIDTNQIYLYEQIELIFRIAKVQKRNATDELISNAIKDYVLKVDDLFFNDHNRDLYEVFANEEYVNLYVKPSLHFIINYIYLLKEENREEDVEALYSFIKVFDKGFGIEEFLIKFEYERLIKKLNLLKVDNDGDIDSAINNISDIIYESNLIDRYDIEKIKNVYPHINFDNLDERVKKYVATGDTIVLLFDKSKNPNFDYSSAVIEWSKAVELESYNKLTSKIQKHSNDINKDIIGSPFKFKDTIGTFEKINERKMKDGRTLTSYLYDEYYKNIYDLDLNTYNILIKSIISIKETRNDSAHKHKSISFVKAKECQNIILSARKILEILSKLNKK